MSANSRSNRAPLLSIYAALVFAFVYLPIVVLIIYSFNRDGVGGFPPRHFTFDWYRQLFADAPIWDAAENSLIVAVGSVALALTLGLLAALALDRANFPGKALFRRLVLLPLILPGIISGLEYEVGSYSTTDEVVVMATAAARDHGFYMTHIRDEGNKSFEALDEEIAIGERVDDNRGGGSGRGRLSVESAS